MAYKSGKADWIFAGLFVFIVSVLIFSSFSAVKPVSASGDLTRIFNTDAPTGLGCANPSTECTSSISFRKECTSAHGGGECSCTCGRFGPAPAQNYEWHCVKCPSGNCNANVGACTRSREGIGTQAFFLPVFKCGN